MNLQEIIREEMDAAMSEAERRIQFRVAQFLLGDIEGVSGSTGASPVSKKLSNKSGGKLLNGKVQTPKTRGKKSNQMVSDPEKVARDIWKFFKDNPWSTMTDVKAHFGLEGSVFKDRTFQKMKRILVPHVKTKGKANKMIYNAIGEGP